MGTIFGRLTVILTAASRFPTVTKDLVGGGAMKDLTKIGMRTRLFLFGIEYNGFYVVGNKKNCVHKCIRSRKP